MAFLSVFLFILLASPSAEVSTEIIKIAAVFMTAVNAFYYFFHYKTEVEYYKQQTKIKKHEKGDV